MSDACSDDTPRRAGSHTTDNDRRFVYLHSFMSCVVIFYFLEKISRQQNNFIRLMAEENTLFVGNYLTRLISFRSTRYGMDGPGIESRR